MKKSTTKVATAQGAVPTIAQSQADLFTMFQAFIAQQGQAVAVPVAVSVPVVSPVGAEGLKSKAKGKAKSKPVASVATAKPEPVATEKTGVHIHELANSFFVYGIDAPAKLAAFFTRKPHLDRGFKERNIEGLGTVKAYWFGGRQIAKVRKEITK